MDYKRINAALHDASDTRRVVIGGSTLGAVDETFAQCFDTQPAVVVADANAFAVAGRTVDQRLRAAGRTVADPIVFPGTPTLYADYDNVLTLEGKLRDHDAIAVVVGSGTLNDITMLASYRVGRQYMCVGTAASMDSYTAFGAAITKDGFKQTMACPAPHALLADLDVLARGSG
jgi:glycerol-1-phosphate dehydrogenase [NAD(P)+]